MKSIILKSGIIVIAVSLSVALSIRANPISPSVKSGASAKKIPASSSSPIDTGAVRKLYVGGDFDQAIAILAEGLKEKKTFTREDSLFIFKYLGVMYAANYDTREKGKFYMRRLLTADPTADIFDMYASDAIYMMYKNVKDEFEATHGKPIGLGPRPTGTAPTPGGGRDPSPGETPSGHGRTYYWIGAGAVVAAAGVAAYFIVTPDSKNKVANHLIQ